MTLKDLHEKWGSTDRVWSIEIAYVLHEFNLDTIYQTEMKGVRDEYSDHDYYQHGLDNDTRRVNALFEKAEKRGVKIRERRVGLDEIQKTLSDDDDHSLIIMLVDKCLLRCSLCDKINHPNHHHTEQRFRRMSNRLERFWHVQVAHSFAGHFVVVFDWDEHSDRFFIKDPAALHDTCVIQSHVLEQARSSFGTDNDILFIKNRS